jgi:hypothetical protein
MTVMSRVSPNGGGRLMKKIACHAECPRSDVTVVYEGLHHEKSVRTRELCTPRRKLRTAGRRA